MFLGYGIVLYLWKELTENIMAILTTPVTTNDHVQGSINAPLTLLEYGDYECRSCGRMHPIIKQVQKHFGNDLRFVFRNFSMAEQHPLAEVAAETAEFAGTYQRFWEMHDLIYENQERLSMQTLFDLTESLKLSVRELKDVLVSRPFLAKIRSDLNSGTHSGVKHTPTLFINGQRYDGSIELAELITAIETG